MKAFKYMTLAALTATAAAAMAQEVGHVLSSQAVIQQVAVPRQVCSSQQVEVAQPKSGAGAAMGALAGGAVGNAIGKGAGNAAATMIGLVGGAIIGDRIEGNPAPQSQTVQNCTTQNFMENRTVGYNVTYEYAGKQYNVQLPQDPGPTIQLQVSPVGAQTQSPISGAQNVTVSPPVVYQQGTTVISPAPVYYAPGYYAPYYPPVMFDFGIGGWGHGRWR